MSTIVNYPVKYAVLELKERGGWLVEHEYVTQGFIASKCYVIESTVVYNANGDSRIIHKVVFPYRNIELFRNSLKKGHPSIGTAEFPRYDINGTLHPINIVTDLFDTYEEAKAGAIEKKEEYICKQYGSLTKEFERKIEVCDLFEMQVLKATNNMEISEEVYPDKPKSFIKVLKPTKK